MTDLELKTDWLKRVVDIWIVDIINLEDAEFKKATSPHSPITGYTEELADHLTEYGKGEYVILNILSREVQLKKPRQGNDEQWAIVYGAKAIIELKMVVPPRDVLQQSATFKIMHIFEKKD